MEFISPVMLASNKMINLEGQSVDRIVVASSSIRKSMLPAATLDERAIVPFITQVLGLRCLRDIRAFDRSNDKK
jgi:hypothetical protein